MLSVRREADRGAAVAEQFCIPTQRGLVVAVHSAAGKRACGGDDVAACQQIRAWHHDHHSASVVIDGLKQVRVLRLTRMRGSAGRGPHVPGPGTVCAGADLTLGTRGA